MSRKRPAIANNNLDQEDNNTNHTHNHIHIHNNSNNKANNQHTIIAVSTPAASVPIESLVSSSMSVLPAVSASVVGIGKSVKGTGASGGSSSSSSTRFSLWLSCQPIRYPFVGVYFPVQVSLLDHKKSTRTGISLNLLVECCYEGGEVVAGIGQAADTPVMQVDPNTPAVINGTTGHASFNVKLCHLSSQHDNRRLCLRVSVDKHVPPRCVSTDDSLSSHQLNALLSIPPVLSHAMCVIRYRLKIIEHPPTSWYKDEGGRDKCISIRAVLVDETEQPVLNKEVPLRVTLCYEGDDEMEVKNQSILKFPSESVLNSIDPSTGQVEIKVRIDQVSKNHQNQAFTIKISPDVHHTPDLHHIAPDISSPVTVLSKRNKRRKKDEGLSNQSSSSMQMSNQVLGGQAGAMASLVHSGGNASHVPVLTTTAAAGTQQQQQEQTMASGVPFSSSPSASASASSFPRLPSIAPSPELTHSLSMLTNWCQYVVRGLISLEWQHVGFEITEAGEVHLHRPLHRCPSCWVYKDAIRPTTHNPKCMLMLAKERWFSDIYHYLSAIIHAASGIPMDHRNTDIVYSSSLQATDNEQQEQQQQQVSASPSPTTAPLDEEVLSDDQHPSLSVHSSSLQSGRHHRRHHHRHHRHYHTDDEANTEMPEPQSAGSSAEEEQQVHMHSEQHDRHKRMKQQSDVQDMSTDEQERQLTDEDEHEEQAPEHPGSVPPLSSYLSSAAAVEIRTDSLSNVFGASYVTDSTPSLPPFLPPQLMPIPSGVHLSGASMLPPNHPQFVASNSYDSVNYDNINIPDFYPQQSNGLNPIQTPTHPVQMFSVQSAASEMNVAAVYVHQSEYGFPAFSQDHILIGFYLEDQSGHGINFFPVQTFLAAPQVFNHCACEVKTLTNAYHSSRLHSPQDIVWKKDWGTLERMKEEAIVRSYAKNTEAQQEQPDSSSAVSTQSSGSGTSNSTNPADLMIQ